MQPFTNDLLTILVLICISWAGLTCIAVLILVIIFIRSSWLKRRRSKSINPTRTHSTVSSISIDNHTPSIPHTPKRTPIKNVDQHKKSELQRHRYDTMSITNEHPHSSSYNNKNKYQHEDFRHDENDETTRINESRGYDQRRQQRQHQSLKPMADMRVNERRTPYPADVVARAKLMNNSRLPMDDKY